MVFEGIELSLPPSFFFDTPPSTDPLTLRPPSHEQSIRSPVAVDAYTYQSSFAAKVPITFSITYFALVTIFNALNRRRRNKPTWIAQTSAFKAIVLLHNFALAVYSGVTCAAMVRALYVSVPGWLGPNGFTATLDGLCKLHGPAGFGNAVTYDPSTLKWTTTNRAIRLGTGGILPNQADHGRIWNEGLAFWGWLFYLSKYYEVVDTIIILLKGKRATTLQKYHHAGALLSMWAGMRYMSPPIWMFVLVNSGIHALMYSFYTASTLGIRVPKGIKQTLTTMQISQFLVGVLYAGAHLFVSYRIPVWPRSTKSATTAPTTASELFSTDRTYDTFLPPWLLKLVYRATGGDRLAETVGRTWWEDSINSGSRSYPSNRTRTANVHCLDTSGQAFAIWLNVVYLTPLTLLFVRFFWKSYVIGKPKRTKQTPPSPRRLSVSARDAAWETSKSFEEYGTEFEKSLDWRSQEVFDRIKDTDLADRIKDSDLANGSVDEWQQELREAYDNIVHNNDGSAPDAIEEIAEALRRSTTDADDSTQKSSGIKLPEANGVSRQSSKSSNKSKGKQQGGDYSEQDWFGRRTVTSSTLKEINPNMVCEEERASESTSTAQLGSWTDIKDEDSAAGAGVDSTNNGASVGEQEGATYADVTKHGEPSEEDNMIAGSKKPGDDDHDDVD